MSNGPEQSGKGVKEKTPYSVNVTYGVRASEGVTDPLYDPLPLSFVRYVQAVNDLAPQIVRAVGKEDGVDYATQVTMAAQDFGRFAMAKPFRDGSLDVDLIERVLTGKEADEDMDGLLRIAVQREAAIWATVGLLRLDANMAITSVLQMLIADRDMRTFTIDYLAAVADGLKNGTTVFHGMRERTLRAASLAALPKRIRSRHEYAAADYSGDPDSVRSEDFVYPHAQGAFAAWTILNRGTYLCPPGYEKVPEFGGDRTIEVLRMITSEVVGKVLGDNVFTGRMPRGELAERVTDQRRGWVLRDELMGRGYNNKGGKPVFLDAYYWLEGFGDTATECDDNGNGGSHEGEAGGEERGKKTPAASHTKQIRIYPPPSDIERFSTEMTGPGGGIEHEQVKEVLRRDMHPVLKQIILKCIETPVGRALLRARARGSRYDKVVQWAQDRTGKILLPADDLLLLGKLFQGFAEEFASLLEENYAFYSDGLARTLGDLRGGVATVLADDQNAGTRTVEAPIDELRQQGAEESAADTPPADDDASDTAGDDNDGGTDR